MKSDRGADGTALAAMGGASLVAGWAVVCPALASLGDAWAVRGAAVVGALVTAAVVARTMRRREISPRRALGAGASTLGVGAVLSVLLAALAGGAHAVSFGVGALGVTFAASLLVGAIALRRTGGAATVDAAAADAAPRPVSIASLLQLASLLSGAAIFCFALAPMLAIGQVSPGRIVAALLLSVGAPVAGSVLAARSVTRAIEGAADAARSPGTTTPDEIERLGAALGALRERIASDLAAQCAPLPPPTQAEQQQEDFLVTVGEELRTPLEEIGALAALLVSGGRLAPAQAEDVALIMAGSGELLGLVEMVLAPPEVQGPLRVQGVDLSVLARDVVKAQRPIATEKRVVLLVEGEDEVLARGDARRLRQVLTNLVSNALKFTPDGRVTVSARRDSADVELTVRDEGVGISEGDLPRLFHAYSQVGGGRARARGTGLGLLICKQIVEAHGGRITVDSEVGHGSVFRVRLPAWSPAPQPPGPRRPRHAGTPTEVTAQSASEGT